MRQTAALLIFAVRILSAQGTFEGTIVNSITGTPIAGATIDLRDANAFTGPSGAFRITGLAPGEYTPSFDADHYFASSGKPFTITTAGETIHVDIDLDPATQLTGRVLNPDGKPIPGMRVETFTRTTRQGIMSFITDKDGYFHPPDLQPGAYFLLARPNRGLSVSPKIQVPGAQPEKTEKKILAPTFYPGVSDPSQAQAILATGGELSGYDIRLRAVPVYRVRGVLRDEAGSPAAKVPLALTNAGLWFLDSMSKSEAETVSGPGGLFEFADVGPGNWRISAQSTRGGVELHGVATVAVSRHDEEDVQLRLNAPFSLEGSAEAPADVKLKGLYLTPVEASRRDQRYADIIDGRFVVKGIYPGPYLLQPASVDGAYISQARLGEQDITDLPFQASPGAPAIHLVYRSDTGSLRGSVEKGGNATVVLYGKGDWFQTARCTPDGKFEIAALRPGQYQAVAFRRVEQDMVDDPIVRQQASRSAVTVRVEPGQQTWVDLRLSASPQ